MTEAELLERVSHPMIRRMSVKPWVGLLLTSFCITQALAASDVDSRGRELIKQAEDKMDIFALPSFRMDASVRINNFGKPLDGTYSLLWNGPDQWREEITFPGYSDIEVESNGTLYVKRSAPYIPYQVFQVHSALGFSSMDIAGSSFFTQTPQAHENVQSIREKKVSGEQADCVEITTELKYSREVCIDRITGLINRGERLVETEFSTVNGKQFPRSIALQANRKPLLNLHVTDLTSPGRLQPSLFDPPQGSVSREGCMNPVPPRKIEDTMPSYPYEDKIAQNQGMVAYYAIIDEKGVPKDFQKLLSASPTWRGQPWMQLPNGATLPRPAKENQWLLRLLSKFISR